jgi:hypothetical protein
MEREEIFLLETRLSITTSAVIQQRENIFMTEFFLVVVVFEFFKVSPGM